MDEFNNEAADYVEEEEEVLEDTDLVLDADEQTEQQRAETADLAKLFLQHPEIWIPYEEQVLEQLNTKAPGPNVEEENGIKLYAGVRDVSILDQSHVTYPFLTSYERTKCISFRASQICNGSKPYIMVPEGVSDAYEIAKMELEAKRLPFILKRPLPDGKFEVWRLSDLVVF
jgi:DNA-directed RNA polymerase I, II, and III subunit RPABC2